MSDARHPETASGPFGVRGAEAAGTAGEQGETSAADASGAKGGQDGPVLLFDGVCNLCNASVMFIIRRDPAARVHFAPLQSEAARALLAAAGAAPGDLPDSMIVLQDGQIFTRSAAALRIARHMRWPWPALGALRLIPRPLRDWAYGVVARNRYRWFGQRDQCMMPTPELKARFLQESSGR